MLTTRAFRTSPFRITAARAEINFTPRVRLPSGGRRGNATDAPGRTGPCPTVQGRQDRHGPHPADRERPGHTAPWRPRPMPVRPVRRACKYSRPQAGCWWCGY
ncbi:hypothetical protein RAA17_13885 [Komagataeibacter rhaeticus]|nr:hypothetical protein [Komagataeibacter rhaeticus]